MKVKFLLKNQSEQYAHISVIISLINKKKFVFLTHIYYLNNIYSLHILQCINTKNLL